MDAGHIADWTGALRSRTIQPAHFHAQTGRAARNASTRQGTIPIGIGKDALIKFVVTGCLCRRTRGGPAFTVRLQRAHPILASALLTVTTDHERVLQWYEMMICHCCMQLFDILLRSGSNSRGPTGLAPWQACLAASLCLVRTFDEQCHS